MAFIPPPFPEQEKGGMGLWILCSDPGGNGALNSVLWPGGEWGFEKCALSGGGGMGLWILCSDRGGGMGLWILCSEFWYRTSTLWRRGAYDLTKYFSPSPVVCHTMIWLYIFFASPVVCPFNSQIFLSRRPSYASTKEANSFSSNLFWPQTDS